MNCRRQTLASVGYDFVLCCQLHHRSPPPRLPTHPLHAHAPRDDPQIRCRSDSVTRKGIIRRGVQGCAAIGCASSPCLASLCTVVRPHLCKALTEVYKGVRESDVHRHPASLRFAPLSDLTCVMSPSQCQHVTSSHAIFFGAPVCTLTFPPPTHSHHTTSHYTLFAHAGIGGRGKIDTQEPCWRVIQSQASRVGSPHHDGARARARALVCVCVCVCVRARACVRA